MSNKKGDTTKEYLTIEQSDILSSIPDERLAPEQHLGQEKEQWIIQPQMEIFLQGTEWKLTTTQYPHISYNINPDLATILIASYQCPPAISELHRTTDEIFSQKMSILNGTFRALQEVMTNRRIEKRMKEQFKTFSELKIIARPPAPRTLKKKDTNLNTAYIKVKKLNQK